MLPKLKIKSFIHTHSTVISEVFVGTFIVLLVMYSVNLYILSQQVHTLMNKNASQARQISTLNTSYLDLKNQDQYKRNNALQATISAIETTYAEASSLYEKLLDLKLQVKDTNDLDKLFAESLNFLSKRNYASAGADLTLLGSNISDQQAKLAAAAATQVSANVTQSNTPPASGLSQQSVNTDAGSFTVSIIAADMGSTKVIVDTASDSDCSNNCPTLPLSDYVARNGAYAGINGNFFCPVDYPSCAGKTGSFDLLVMNKNKHYFNSSNNVYSTNPAVIFGNGFIRFVGQAQQWGRDTSVDGVLSNFPLLVSGGNIAYGDSGDPKFISKGTRDFVANKGNTVYIGVIYNATMGEAAKVLKALGMDNAMNLDEGGSTALWDGGYIVGPGRNIPDAILFLHK